MVKSKEKKYLLLFSSIALSIVFLDQIAKYYAAIFLLEWNLAFISIHFVHNTGAGFGILKGQMGILAFISALAALAVIFFTIKYRRKNYRRFYSDYS